MTETPEQPKPTPSTQSQLIKLAVDLGPLIAFFAVYLKSDIYTATAVLMATTVASLAASKLLLGHVATMPIVTAVLVVVFGGLTMWLQDPTFIKVKPTILYLMFAAALGIGLWFDKLFLKTMLGEAISYTELGWRKLTVRWMGFFAFLALLNEAVWRNFSEATWVSFKTFGFLPLTMAFAVGQFIALRAHAVDTDDK